MKKLTLIALSLLVAAFIGCGKVDAQENLDPGKILLADHNQISQILGLNKHLPVDPNAPKDYDIKDAVRNIPYITDDGGKKDITAQRRLQEVKSLSRQIQINVNHLLEMISDIKSDIKREEYANDLEYEGFLGVALLMIESETHNVASGLKKYAEKLEELPDEFEWKDEFLEKTTKSRIMVTYILCRIDGVWLDAALLDVNSSPTDILDFMDRGLAPHVMNYPNTVLYQNFQRSLKNYCKLIADPETISKYPEVAARNFLDKLKTMRNVYNVEITGGAVTEKKTDFSRVEKCILYSKGCFEFYLIL